MPTANQLSTRCEAINRVLKTLDPRSKTAQQLTEIYNDLWNQMCDLRWLEGPTPLVSPLRKDPA